MSDPEEAPAPAPQGEMKVAHTYMGAGPTVESAASLAHTGQVVRIKTKGQTFFLECDAADTPTMLIKRLEKLGHVSPQPLSLHFGASHSSTSTRPLPCARARLLGSGRSGSGSAWLRATAGCSHVRGLRSADKIPKSMTGGYLARLMRGPIPLDMYKPVSGQQVGPVRIHLQSKPS